MVTHQKQKGGKSKYFSNVPVDSKNNFRGRSQDGNQYFSLAAVSLGFFPCRCACDSEQDSTEGIYGFQGPKSRAGRDLDLHNQSNLK